MEGGDLVYEGNGEEWLVVGWFMRAMGEGWLVVGWLKGG